MTTQPKPTRSVTAEVLGHKKWNGRMLIELDVKEWPNRYPISLYNARPEALAALPIGNTFHVRLFKDGLKKDGADPAYPSNYHWTFDALTTPEEVAKEQAILAERRGQKQGGQGRQERSAPRDGDPPVSSNVNDDRRPVSGKRPTSYDEREDIRQVSISSGVALKAAVKYHMKLATLINYKEHRIEVLATADEFYRWLNKNREE